MSEPMDLEQYRACLNLLGQAGWYLQHAQLLSNEPHLEVGTMDAFKMARLALHALIERVNAQAAHHYDMRALDFPLGDPGANMSQLEYGLTQDATEPYWKIA